ncbi:MAG: Xaa-Pro peptidase family protein [Planctomycetaceae bacterium]|nr:Xaa-Pro peptidase family protein [Planctomycetaceae bacterium]
MSGPNYSARRSRLIRSLKSAGVDGLLLTGEANVRYLTGFTGDSTWLMLSSAKTLIISDTRYATQLKDECPDLDVDIRDASCPMAEATAAVVRKAKIGRLGFEADHVSVAVLGGLQAKMDVIELIPTSGLTEKLREVKDKWELQQIRDAVEMAERGIGVVRASLRPQQTEKDVRYTLEAAMRSFGASGPGFEPIVGVGPTAALPHAHAGDLLVSDSPVLLIDWGAETPSGYRSDLTRVFFTGRITKQMQNVYEVVLKAQQKAIAAIKPGVRCRAVDKIARSIIADAGFGKYFGHGLGHGFGLEIHESVRMSPLSDQVFEPGMVVTVEPGIYLPGKFGVRIEDDILVTRDGHEVLSSVPREFDDAIVEYLA